MKSMNHFVNFLFELTKNPYLPRNSYFSTSNLHHERPNIQNVLNKIENNEVIKINL